MTDSKIMHNFKDMSPSDHEEVSIRFLVKFRDVYEERIEQGEIKADDLIGEKSELVEDLLLAYFDIRRSHIPIPYIDANFSCKDMIDFINDEILHFLSDERPELLEYDPRDGRYYMLFDNDND